PRHKRTLFHPPSQASAPELHLVGTKTTTKRQLNNLSSQVKTLDLSTPGGSSYSNLLVFPVLVPDFFADNKTRKTLLSVLLSSFHSSLVHFSPNVCILF
ncbi:hypothetical protein ILYODFUR_038008, partial [Ilyodon furcidens]